MQQRRPCKADDMPYLAQHLTAPVDDCFRRAVLALESLSEPTAQYVEGVAVVRIGAGSLVPTEHGWVEVTGQYIIDTKWPDGRAIAYFPALRLSSAEVTTSHTATIRLPILDRRDAQRKNRQKDRRAAWVAAVAYIRDQARAVSQASAEVTYE